MKLKCEFCGDELEEYELIDTYGKLACIDCVEQIAYDQWIDRRDVWPEPEWKWIGKGSGDLN